MRQYDWPTRTFALGASVGITLCLLSIVQVPRAQGFIDLPVESLTHLIKDAEAIAVLRVEKVNLAKKGIVYRKIRDLKGSFPNPARDAGETITHIINEAPNLHVVLQPHNHMDLNKLEKQDEAILAWASEGKTGVIFHRGFSAPANGEQAICIGPLWYTARARRPPEKAPWVYGGACDARFTRFFCGDSEELTAAIVDVLASKEVSIPCMVGTAQIVSDRSGPILRYRADREGFPHRGQWTGDFRPKKDFRSPFGDQPPWSTHRGNPQRTGSDDSPGPKVPKLLWVHKSGAHFIAPLVPGVKDLYASGLEAFHSPILQAFALDASRDKQVRWTKGAPLLRQPSAGAPALLGGKTEMLVFGDGFHTSDGSSLRCVRASDGLPLWQLPVAGDLVHFEGTPTIAYDKLYAGGGNAGVLCVEPGRVTLDEKEYDLPTVQTALEKRWKELLAKYEIEKKKDPEFALPPNESMLPRATPKRIWQQGKDKWHVDAPVAVVEDRVLAASAYLDGEQVGERALVCLNAGNGEVLWKTALKLNPWAGPTVGPYVLVGCSSIRLDPKAVAGAKGEVVAVELDTGKVKWRKDVPGGVLSSVAVKAGMAIFTATDGKVRAWDAFTGQEKWTYDARAPFFAGPAIAKNTVYAADLKGVVHALNLADGKKEWVLDLGTDLATKVSGMVYGSPIVHRGRLYLATCSLGEKAAQTPNVVICIADK